VYIVYAITSEIKGWVKKELNLQEIDRE